MEAEFLDQVVGRIKQFLAVRDRSSVEVRRKILERRLCSPEDADQVVAALQERGIVDNERFARNRIASRLHRGYGPRYIAGELRTLGVSESLARELLGEVMDEDCAAHAVELATPILERHLGAPDVRDRVTRKLVARGFTMRQVELAEGLLREQYPHWGRRFD